jgi:twitching motility two-component system response regulator PilH
MANKAILIVDDNPSELETLHLLLKSKGYIVYTAVDGEDAIAKALQVHPRLILLDIILPKKNGFQVCRQLKTSPDTKDIKIIMVTQKNQESDRFWGLRQGADEYLTKPLKDESLLAYIAKHI